MVSHHQDGDDGDDGDDDVTELIMMTILATIMIKIIMMTTIMMMMIWPGLLSTQRTPLGWRQIYLMAIPQNTGDQSSSSSS